MGAAGRVLLWEYGVKEEGGGYFCGEWPLGGLSCDGDGLMCISWAEDWMSGWLCEFHGAPLPCVFESKLIT